MKTLSYASIAAVALAAAACTSKQTQPEIASSAGQPAYAATYPDELQSSAKGVSDDRVEARNIVAAFPQRVQELKGPADANTLTAIVDRADESGRSQGYASRKEEIAGTRAFWEAERGTITGRVAGAAQSKVNESKCENADVSGAVAYALRESFDKQLEKRQRAANDAQVLVERYKTSLGQANAAVAQKLADDVAQASYLVNVALLEDRNHVTAMLAEKGAVDSALGHAIDDEKSFQQEKGRTDAEKKASEDRIAALNKSRSSIGGAVVNAEVAMRGIDDQIKAAKDEYTAAIKALKDQIKQRPEK